MAFLTGVILWIWIFEFLPFTFLSLRLAVMLMRDTFIRSEVVTWIMVGGVVIRSLKILSV